MRKYFILMVLFCSTLVTRADVITGTLTGTVAGVYTVDSLGIFGAAGADLIGQTITFSYSYSTADFAATPGSCGTGCTIYPATLYSSSEYLTATVGTVSKSYTTNVVFPSLGFNNPAIGLSEFSEDISSNAGGLAFSIESPVPLSFGSPIPDSQQSGIISQREVFYPGSGMEQITFSSGTVSNPLDAQTPEPSGLTLLGSGVLAVMAVGRRKLVRE